MPARTTHSDFTAALDALVERLREDRSILAAILCGSLSHDRVWARSDIDIVLVTVDDRKLDSEGMTLYADGVNVHAMLVQRAAFRKMIEGSLRNSFVHSYLAKGRLLYAHDESIPPMFERLGDIGERDTRIQLFHAATEALPSIYKAHKFLITRGDLEYTAMWILHAAVPLAKVEVLTAHQLAGREVIQQALEINPSFFKVIYTDLLNAKKTKTNVTATLKAVDDYLAARAAELFAPVIEHLNDAGETRSCTELENHFTRTYGIHGVTMACEYLADIGLVGKASVTTRLTKRSTADVQELAFYGIG
ncbi:MAG: hypothetical protein ABIY52_17600 [Gemmatimonadaceae bacterium]